MYVYYHNMSQTKPQFLANNNDATLTRRQRARHAEAPGNMFHFEIDSLYVFVDFHIFCIFSSKLTLFEDILQNTSLEWLPACPQGLFFLKNSTCLRNITKYKLGVATGVPAGAFFPQKQHILK